MRNGRQAARVPIRSTCSNSRTSIVSGDPVAIAGYLGSSHTFDHALIEFAERYADQNERDYEVFLEEIRSGQLEVAPEPVG